MQAPNGGSEGIMLKKSIPTAYEGVGGVRLGGVTRNIASAVKTGAGKLSVASGGREGESATKGAVFRTIEKKKRFSKGG